MPYLHALEDLDYTDYSGGRVLYSQPGQTALPVRLASEILQRCLAIRTRAGLAGPCTLHDPCCGGAYHLTALGFLHGRHIAAITASDISQEALDLAGRNLSLLTLAGLDRRIAEITGYVDLYGKLSHRAALLSAQKLRRDLSEMLAARPMPVHLFQADAFNRQAIQVGLAGQTIDLVISDVPYGWKSSWAHPSEPCEGSKPSQGLQ